MVDPVDVATFIGGIGETKEEEQEIAEMIGEHVAEAHQKYPDEEIIITHAPITQSDMHKYQSMRTIQLYYYGFDPTGCGVRRVSKPDYQTLTKDTAVKYFVQQGKYTAVGETLGEALKYLDKKETIGNIKESIVQSVRAIPKTLAASAKVAAQAAFYGTLFAGVNNLFGLNSLYLDYVYPYIPDILIQTMPFFSVQKLERGMSDRLLKYRAIGDVFLAHQRGATDTLRIDMTLFGPYRGWSLLYLLQLQGSGEGRLKDLVDLKSTDPIGDPPPHEIIKIPKEGKVQYESHITFPIITKTAFMLDMFLQTIEWHQENDRGGHNVIYVHLLFRKHIDPLGYNVYQKGKGFLDYGETQIERLRKEVLIDTAWKARQIGNEYFNVGMFGGRTMWEIDREAVASDPYVTDIAKLVGGYVYDINGLEV